MTGLSISAGLHLIQRGVAAAHFDELVVTAGFDDSPIIQHQYLVGHSHRREPVADQKGSLAYDYLAEPLEQLVFSLGIEGGGRLVQDHQAGVSDESARQSHLLPLAAG